MMPLTANVAAVPASFLTGCTRGGLLAAAAAAGGPLLLVVLVPSMSPLLLRLLLSLVVVLLLVGCCLLPAPAAAAEAVGCCVWIQVPSTIGSYMSERRVRLTVLFQRLQELHNTEKDTVCNRL